jgi:hypothetical protein
MLDNFINAPWSQWVLFFSEGHPPLALQFLIINAFFFLVFAIRRMRGKRSNHANTAYAVHGGLILVNLGLLYQAQLLPYYSYHAMNFVHKLQQVI